MQQERASANFHLYYRKVQRREKEGLNKNTLAGCFSHLHPGCAQSRGDIYNSALLLLLHVRQSFMYTPPCSIRGFHVAERVMYTLAPCYMLRGEQIFLCAVGNG
jgi:hypothetical protein